MQQFKHFTFEQTEEANNFIKTHGIKMQQGSHLSTSGITIIYEDGIFSNVARRESLRESLVKDESELIASSFDVRLYKENLIRANKRRGEIEEKLAELVDSKKDSEKGKKEKYDLRKELEAELKFTNNQIQNSSESLIVNQSSVDRLKANVAVYKDMIAELDKEIEAGNLTEYNGEGSNDL